MFDGLAFAPVMKRCIEAHRRVLAARVRGAAHARGRRQRPHQHPVNSDDYAMLQSAHASVARIMALARSLDGVISGEHGIGITKLEYLTPDELAPFADYKQRVDPEGRFNRGKLLAGADLSRAYTPSFNLLGAESLILEQSDVGGIADSIKDCLRCGKCKPVCATHAAREPALQPAQQDPRHVAPDRGVSLRGTDSAGRACATSTSSQTSPTTALCATSARALAGRHRLRRRVDRDAKPLARAGHRTFNAGTAAAMFFLGATRRRRSPRAQADDRLGIQSAVFASLLARRLGVATDRRRGRPRRWQSADPLASAAFHQQADAGRLPKRTARALLDIEDPASSDHPQPEQPAEDSDAVFYFPGCGSERLFSQVGWRRRRCSSRRCPVRAAARVPVLRLSADGCGQSRQRTEDHHRQPRPVPSRRNTLNYLDIKTVIVSCGT